MGKRVTFSEDKEITFNYEFENFSEVDGKKGVFKGLLVNMSTDSLAKNCYKFMKGSMKGNDGKQLFMMYNHYGNIIPVGVMSGTETSKGFEIEAEFHLAKDEAGNYINQEAVKLYSLMKDMKLKFDLSVGGVIKKYRELQENGKYKIEILEFNAYEGSLTPKGAVAGSSVTRVFNNEENQNNENEGEIEMTPEQQKAFIASLITAMQQEVFKAETDKEIKALPTKLSELEGKFSGIKEELTEELKESFKEQFNEINTVIKGLKSNYVATPADVKLADEFLAAFAEIKANNGKMMEITPETVLQMAAASGTTEGEGTKAAVKAHQLIGIMARLQEVNPIVADLNIIPITDNSIDIDREEIGLPEVAWVGEEDVRSETDIAKLKDVSIKMHQIYALPKLSNKLVASNYVGYVNFLMSRVEYAWALKIANTMFNGTGEKQPLGILKDPNITNKVEWDVANMTDEQIVDSIITIHGNTRDEIASQAKWYMRRETWTRLTLIKDKDGKLQLVDLKTGGERKLMTRPVVIVDSANSGLKTIAEIKAGEPLAAFADVKRGMMGITNTKMNLKLVDQVTTKGWTAYYMEKGLGFGVVLPEYFTIIKNKGTVAA